MKNKKEKIKKEEIKELVIARLETLSPNKKISIGSEGEFTKEELISRVQKEDSIGEKIIDVQMEFLRSLKEGILYEQDFSDYETKT
jgi:hypothetical protein